MGQDLLPGVGSAIAGIFKSKKKKVITRSMARDKDSEGDDCDMMEEQKESNKPIAKKIVKPSFKELIALQNPLGFWPETAKHIFDNFARNGDCHNFPKAAALIQNIEA